MPDADWLEALRASCEATSQRKVAAQLGVSATAVNQALNGTYTAKTDRIERRVREVLMPKAAAPVEMHADPAWFEALRNACLLSSQVDVARKLGVSTTTVNQVLKGTYGASTRRIEATVRAHLLGERIDCPAQRRLIPLGSCLDQSERVKSRRFSELTTQLGFHKVCPTCPNNVHRNGASR